MHRTIPVLVLVSAGISMGYGCTGVANTTHPTPTDPCAGVTCTSHGTCAVTSADLPICACDPNYHAQGLDCVSDADPCDGIDCSAHGTCVVNGELATCNCDADYHADGLACIADPVVNPCESVLCSGHGTCVVVSDAASCACDADYHAEGLACVADPVADAPVVTLVANPTTVDSGGTTTLTWSSTNATSCTASGAWSGSRATSGSEASAAITTASTFTLACTGPGGTTQRSATVYLTGGELVFFDDFEYAVGREEATAPALFTAHGWNGAKTEQAGQEGANGWLYTTTTFPGHTGEFPGISSSRVLAIEARPGTEGAQTDFYLEYGDGENPAYDNAVPGNVWFQFWIYINYAGDQLSQISSVRNKFIYPCNGSYNCHTGKWLFGIGNASFEPYWTSLGEPSSDGGFLTNTAQGVDEGICTVTYDSATEYINRMKFGHTDTSEHMAANRWTLVKLHVDTSTTSGRYEAWMRPAQGAWVKVAEWIDGVTPGFAWTINPAQVGGHRVFRMPSTWGQASASVWYDAWMYMDDFAMATSEAALPVYP